MNNQINILDCTLRDGGLGLEDANKNEISKSSFPESIIDRIGSLLSMSKVEIIELGAIELSPDDKTRFAIYQDIETISNKIPAYRAANQLFVGLYRGPDTPIDQIPDWNPSLVDGVRVILRYSELQKSLDFCAALAKKGYKVFVQPMLTMRYTDDEINQVISASNEMGAYALYFVDSYGYMMAEDVKMFMEKYDKELDRSIKIGFHAHNNLNLAFSNVIEMLRCKGDREIIIDSCIMGMGQGAGNTQTELIAPYLMKHFGKEYNYEAMLDICELLEKFHPTGLWGYSTSRLLPAIHKTAYKYAIIFRNKYGMTYSQIHRALSGMSQELRYRYTPENAELVLKQFLSSH